MRWALRLLTVLVLLCGLGLRAIEFHAHDGGTHPDTCAVCRVLHAPFVAPNPGPAVQPLLATKPDRPLTPGRAIAPQSPHLAGLHLRAPPCA